MVKEVSQANVHSQKEYVSKIHSHFSETTDYKFK